MDTMKTTVDNVGECSFCTRYDDDSKIIDGFIVRPYSKVVEINSGGLCVRVCSICAEEMGKSHEH